MPGGYKNIKPSDCKNGLDKNPQNINRSGRPKKLFSELLQIAEEVMDGSPLDHSQLRKLLDSIFTMSLPQLTKFLNHERVKAELPQSLYGRLFHIVSNFKTQRLYLEALNDLENRYYGKPKETIIEKTSLEDRIDNLSEEELIELIEKNKDKLAEME